MASLPPSLLIITMIPVITTLMPSQGIYAVRYGNDEGMRASKRSPPSPGENNHQHQTPATRAPPTSASSSATSKNQEGLSGAVAGRSRCYFLDREPIESDARFIRQRCGSRSSAYHVSRTPPPATAPPPPPFTYMKDQPFFLDPVEISPAPSPL